MIPSISSKPQQQYCLATCKENELDILLPSLHTTPSLKDSLQSDVLFAALDRAFPDGCDTHKSCRILKEWAKSHAVDTALLALSWHGVKKYELNYYHYNTVIGACTKTAMWKDALNLRSRMAQRQVQPSMSTFNATISAHEKGSDWGMGLELFNAMERGKVEPGAITFSAAISACKNSGE
eukprot:TRINITY_DN99719_c0_g1_i1.p1 TRINITY_DN99719_c0_g1~~TRINITY_DN99719_c0_g1_i1.p1  ORF type:complete len:180 (-),score=19.93 TRINITY_DN99719_c0_g1_i1:1-540(-)